MITNPAVIEAVHVAKFHNRLAVAWGRIAIAHAERGDDFTADELAEVSRGIAQLAAHAERIEQLAVDTEFANITQEEVNE